MKKMVMAVVPKAEAENVLNALVNVGHTATYTESRGGMLRQSQFTLFIAVDAQELETVLSIIREHCRVEVHVGSPESGSPSPFGSKPVAASVGGSVVFIWNLEEIKNF